MREVVVDASVVVKWLVPEIHSGEAERLLTPFSELFAPDLLFAEIANVLWMKVRRGEILPDQARQRMDELPNLPIATIACRALASEAHALAIATGRSGYDAMYLALALRLDSQVITADARFFNGVKSMRRFAPHIAFIGDY